MGQSAAEAAVIAVLPAVASLVVLVLFGVVAARMGILDTTGRQRLSRATFHFFAPCLFFSGVSRAVSPSTTKILIFAPLAVVHITSAALLGSAVLSVLLGRNPRPPGPARAAAARDAFTSLLLASTFTNSGDIPIALARGMGGKGPLSSDGAVERAVGLVGVYMIVQNCLVGFASALVGAKAAKAGEVARGGGDHRPSSANAKYEPLVADAGDNRDPSGHPHPLTSRSSSSAPYPESPAPGPRAAGEAADLHTSPAGDGGGDGAVRVFDEVTRPATRAAQLRQIAKSALLNPLSVATIAGIAVGLISPVHDALYGADGEGTFVSRFFDSTGAAHIPVAMMLVGALLSHGPRIGGGSGGGASRGPSTRVVASIVVIRLFLLPALNFFVAWLLLRAGVLDTEQFFIAAFIAATPTASMVLVVHQSHSYNEHVLAPLYFFQYPIVAVSLTIWAVFASVVADHYT